MRVTGTLSASLTRRAFAFLAMGLLVFRASPAYAHPGTPPQPHDLWSAWPLSLGPIVGLLAAAWLYWRGHQAWRHRGRRLGWRAGAFAAGWLSLAVALVTPLDSLGHALFSAHMAQHLLLMLAAAPLLALSAPLGPLLMGLPYQAGSALGAWWPRAHRVRGAWRVLSHPVTAWGLHTLALWVWHAPGLYQAALTNAWLHGLEHVAFLGTALLFWWALLHPSRTSRWLLGPGGSMYVFTMALQGGLLGALMTLAPQPWYPIYAAWTEAWGLSLLGDQQLAGAIMWIPSGLVYLGAALAVLGAWLAAMERRDGQLMLNVPPEPAPPRLP
jgi:putative membrane protein